MAFNIKAKHFKNGTLVNEENAHTTFLKINGVTTQIAQSNPLIMKTGFTLKVESDTAFIRITDSEAVKNQHPNQERKLVEAGPPTPSPH